MEKTKNVGIALLIIGILALLFDEVVFKFCGIILVVESILFLPIMNVLCKTTNKYFSLGRKEALGIGTLLIPLFYSIANGYEVKSTVVIILIYWILMFFFNNVKYDENIIQDTIDDLSQKLDKLQGDLDIIQKDVKSYEIEEVKVNKEKLLIKRPKENENVIYYKPPINLLDRNSEGNKLLLKDAINYIKSDKELNVNNLLVCLGKDKKEEYVCLDLKKSQNILVTGCVGYGKSTLINNIIMTLLMRNKANEVKLMISETKGLDLLSYECIPNLLSPICTDYSKALLNLQKLNILIDERIEILKHYSCKNIEMYNELVDKNHKKGNKELKKMSYIISIIDDFSDLMMNNKNDTEDALLHLARLGSNVGVHLIAVTRNVSSNVITNNVKSSLQTVITFDLTSSLESKLVIGKPDAANIDRIGYMFFKSNINDKLNKIHGIYVSDNEISKVVSFIKSKNNYLTYDESIVFLNNNDKDALYDDILNYAIENGVISASIIQKKFSIGYNRAARIIDMFEDQGFVSKENGSAPREVLVKYEDN